MYAGSKYESHYTVWTAWISIRVRVRVGVYFILQNLAPPGTTVHVPTAVKCPDDCNICDHSYNWLTFNGRISLYTVTQCSKTEEIVQC